MINEVTPTEHKGWDETVTMTDVFNYYCEGLKFYGRAWRRAKLATWIDVFTAAFSVAELIILKFKI